MLERIIIHHGTDPKWLIFSDPLEVLVATDPVDVIATLTEAERRVNAEGLFAAGYVGYEAAAGFDSAYVTHPGNRLPLVCLGLFPKVQRSDEEMIPNRVSQELTEWRMTRSRSSYLDDLSVIKRQIELGNTYQINYTVRKCAEDIVDPWNLFLETAADAPYAAFVDCKDHAIVSASPELFFQLDGEQLVSKPMKGTAQRGLTSAQDLAFRQGLCESHKNRAENVMITDMVRNDLGRIAMLGSVEVPALFEIEKYPTVWQMTSTVSARAKVSVSEIFRALFPCASVTGAPKVSSMAIIAELEDSPREIYTGAIGFLGPHRQARFNVAIRTTWVDKKTNEAVYGVGGGIVWDSDPDEEYRECLTKARVLATSSADRDFELLETMLWTPQGGFFLLDEHLSRMRASAEYFDFDFDQATIREALASLAERVPTQRYRIRLLLQRDGRLRSIETPITNDSEIRTQRIMLAREPIDTDTPFVHHKTTRREVYEQALRAAGDCDDVLLWNEDGYITETSIANVVVRIDGERYTPPIECGLLAGTYRESLLRKGEVKERKIHVAELSPASELTLINSVRGEYPARLCGLSVVLQHSQGSDLMARSTTARQPQH